MSYNPLRIISSAMDQDFYKFTMGQLAFHRFPNLNVRWKFKCRNPNIVWTEEIAEKIYEEIKAWTQLFPLSSAQVSYLRSLELFKDTYLRFLRTYRPDPNDVSIMCDGRRLEIEITGPWAQTTYWEVPVLAIVSELYTPHLKLGDSDGEQAALDELSRWKDMFNTFHHNHGCRPTLADFGTRRRYSNMWHDKVLSTMSTGCSSFVGTSNVQKAWLNDIKPIGTMAHEFLQIGQAIGHPRDSQKRMLQEWVDEYRGRLGIALTDIVGINAFLRDFDLYFAKLYDGLRHDSGPPMDWARKVIGHYRKLGIDPMTKTLVFSDGLDRDTVKMLVQNLAGQAKLSFGVGTNLTNFFPTLRDEGRPPLQIVMKIVEVDGRAVAKLSDSAGKCMCDDDNYVAYLRDLFR